MGDTQIQFKKSMKKRPARVKVLDFSCTLASPASKSPKPAPFVSVSAPSYSAPSDFAPFENASSPAPASTGEDPYLPPRFKTLLMRRRRMKKSTCRTSRKPSSCRS